LLNQTLYLQEQKIQKLKLERKNSRSHIQVNIEDHIKEKKTTMLTINRLDSGYILGQYMNIKHKLLYKTWMQAEEDEEKEEC
jgi:hypothetical protein